MLVWGFVHFWCNHNDTVDAISFAGNKISVTKAPRKIEFPLYNFLTLAQLWNKQFTWTKN